MPIAHIYIQTLQTAKKSLRFSQQFPNGNLNFGSLENRKNNEKNQGNQRKGRNERNRGRNDGNQGRNDRNQVPYWAVWNQDSNYGGNSAGNSAGNSSQEFGRGFGRNPDWLQQQPSGYSRSSSQDTGYNSYGNYNSYDNYK